MVAVHPKPVRFGELDRVLVLPHRLDSPEPLRRACWTSNLLFTVIRY